MSQAKDRVETPDGEWCEFHSESGSFGRDEFLNQSEWVWFGKFAVFISCVSVIINLATICWIYVHREEPVLRFSQLHFLLGFTASMLIVNIGIFMFVIELDPTFVWCQVEDAVTVIGLAFALVILFLKEFRAYIIDRRTARFERIGTFTLQTWLLFSFASFICIALIIAWYIIDPPVPDECSYTLCYNGTMALVFWMFLVFLGCLVGVMAWLTRNVSPTLSESRAIRNSVPPFVILLILVVIIGHYTNTSAQAVKLSFAIIILSLTTLTLGQVVYSKTKFFGMNAENLRKHLIENMDERREKQRNRNSHFAKSCYDCLCLCKRDTSGSTSKSIPSNESSDRDSESDRRGGKSVKSEAEKVEQICTADDSDLEPQQCHIDISSSTCLATCKQTHVSMIVV